MKQKVSVILSSEKMFQKFHNEFLETCEDEDIKFTYIDSLWGDIPSEKIVDFFIDYLSELDDMGLIYCDDIDSVLKNLRVDSVRQTIKNELIKNSNISDNFLMRLYDKYYLDKSLL